MHRPLITASIKRRFGEPQKVKTDENLIADNVTEIMDCGHNSSSISYDDRESTGNGASEHRPLIILYYIWCSNKVRSRVRSDKNEYVLLVEREM